MKRGVNKLLNKRRMKLGWVMLTFVLVFGIVFGCLGVFKGKVTSALSGDPSYWTVSDDDLYLTIVNVSQYDANIIPTWSDYAFNEERWEFGNYYFPVANNTDTVTVDFTINGMSAGQTYRMMDGEEINSESNGVTLRRELKPHAYSMRDSYSCPLGVTGEGCWKYPYANEYTLDVYVQSNNGSEYVSKKLIVRPAVVGSSHVEIMSVKQGEENVVLDTTGWQVSSFDEMVNAYQTINEYQLNNYSTPITLTYKLKNLEIGRSYSVSIGNDYHSITADATEKTETRTIALDMSNRHTNMTFSLYGSGQYEGENVSLFFRITDENYVPLGDLVIDAIAQNNTDIVPVADESGWAREYTFSANDAQPVTVYLHATRATADLNYYLAYSMFGNGSYLSADAPIAVTGEELERQGVALTIPAGFGLSEKSPFSVSFSISTVGDNVYSYGSQMVVYENYAVDQQNSDRINISYYEDENIPRFGASISYTGNGAPEIDGNFIDARYHDAEHPLKVRIEGERYDNGQTYQIVGKVRANREDYYSRTFVATGAELNAGKDIILDGLTLSLPVFDPSGSTSGYDLSYEFSLEINGLEQRGEMVYAYDGWISTLVTYDGGEVAASGKGSGGIGGNMYMTSTGRTMSRASLSGSRHPVFHYLGGAFDDDLSYNYAIYYNGNVGNDWWSAAAGNKIEEGVMPGRSLNTDGIALNLTAPSNESNGVLYTLVVTRNGGIVIVSRDYIAVSNAPQVESFKFTADSDSFMQTGSQSYRVARGTTIAAKLTGSGFEDEEEYKLWVSYEGYHTVASEYGYDYTEPVELTGLDNVVTVTGAQLNAGYVYEMEYDDALGVADFVDVAFEITDKNNERPNMYDELTEGVYAGHSIYLEYVADEDVFNGYGFQIDEETGAIIDVSQPDEPGGVPIDNRTAGTVEYHTEGDTLVMVSDKPTLVIGVNGGNYQIVEVATSIDDNGTKTNTYDIQGFDGVILVIKGDGDFDGVVSTSDSNLINRSLISPSLRPYRPLSDLERIIFDVDGDGDISTSDSNLINRSLISPSLRPYHPIEW